MTICLIYYDVHFSPQDAESIHLSNMIKQQLSMSTDASPLSNSTIAPIGTKGTIGDRRTRHQSVPQPFSGSTLLSNGDSNMSTSVDSNAGFGGNHYSAFGSSNQLSGGLLSSSLRSFHANSINSVFRNQTSNSPAASGSLLFQPNHVALDKRKSFDNDPLATDIRARHNSGPFHPNAPPAINGFSHTASLPLPIGMLYDYIDCITDDF